MCFLDRTCTRIHNYPAGLADLKIILHSVERPEQEPVNSALEGHTHDDEEAAVNQLLERRVALG